MTVHKFKIFPSSDEEGEYTLAQYARRHFIHHKDSAGQSSSIDNWRYKINQQRFFVAAVLFGLAIFSGCISLRLFITGQVIEATGLLIIMMCHLLVIRWHLKPGSDWLVVLLSMGALLAIFTILLVIGGELSGGVLWSLTMAPAFFFVLGHKWGGVCFSFSMIVALLMFFAPAHTGIVMFGGLSGAELIDKQRFLGIFLLLGMYGFLLEYNRSRVVSSLLSSRDKLRIQASTDELTGLANRHKMRECLNQQERRSVEHKESYGLILADIDHFKQINDKYGHDCGDYVITSVANALKSALRDEDVVARWGGEEFLVALPDSDTENAMLVANKLRDAISQLDISYGGESIYPTLSFGVVSGGRYQKVQDLISQADHCLYQAKHKGRDCIVFA